MSALAGLKFVTDAAPASILKVIERSPREHFSESISRWTVGRSLSSLASIETSVGPLLQEIELLLSDGTPFSWEVLAPAALLNYLCSVAPSFSNYFESLVSSRCSTPGAPLNIIVYVDEAVPGNLLALDNTRKCWCFYWQFEESGQQVLSREDCWFLGGVLRSSICRKLRGGISCF